MTRRVKKDLLLEEGDGKRKNGNTMGIDVHKTVLACCIVNEAKILYEKNHENTKIGFSTILKQIKKFDVESVAMEATSTYHLKLCFALTENGIDILLANAKQTADTQGKKTDKLDARRIAIAHRDGRLKPSVISPKEYTHLRRSTRKLAQLIQDQTKLKQRIHQVFHLYDCSLRKLHQSFLKTKWSLALLTSCLELEEKNDNKKIKEFILDYYPKKKLSKKSNTEITRLETELANLRNSLSLIERVNLLTDLYQIQFLAKLIEQHRLIYHSFAKQNSNFNKNMQVLLSIPGVGPDTAATLLAEIVDIKLFTKPEKLVKWAGLAPRVLQSGHRKKITGKIHKGGNKHVRRAMTLACTNIYARGDSTNPIRLSIKKLYEKKEAYWLAICAGSRKLLSIIWIMLNFGKSWKPRTLSDTEFIEQVQKKVDYKINIYKSKIKNYEKIQSRLSELLIEDISELEMSSKYVKDFRKIFELVV